MRVEKNDGGRERSRRRGGRRQAKEEDIVRVLYEISAIRTSVGWLVGGVYKMPADIQQTQVCYIAQMHTEGPYDAHFKG